MSHYLAIDLGAESGRLILGTLENNRLSMREIYRFANGMLQIDGHYHWNIENIYNEILKGIEICVHKEHIVPESIGIDSWGVDYGLLAEDGSLMGLPFAYRDARTEGAIEEFCGKIAKEDIYAATGNHFAPYNTLFQLYAAKKYHANLIDAASDLLFIPDLLAYFLTGEKKTEFSFATTCQLFNQRDKCWDEGLFDALGVSRNIMQEVMYAGATIGTLNKTVMSAINVPAIPVVAVATHDTASAIAAIPVNSAVKTRWAFISSGTWSLMGIETEKPVINENTQLQNFTNEGGIEGRNYLLKNLMGLWILQQCRKAMKQEGRDYDYSELMKMAAGAKPFEAFIDIDDSGFLNPENMCKAIETYCLKTKQIFSNNDGQIARVVLESLAMKYNLSLSELREFKQIDEIYITGGGINNELLCQFTANACNLSLIATLSEGSAAGNLMAQALGAEKVKSQEEIREIMAASCSPKTYIPADSESWQEAFRRYLSIIK
jgi:rhamnulokinase